MSVMSKTGGYLKQSYYEYLMFLRRHTLSITTGVLIFLGLIVVLWPYSVHFIPAGSKGVLYKRLGSGTDLDTILEEGVAVTLPWNKVTLYTTRIQQQTTEIEVLTSDRLKSKMTISFQFNAYPYNLPLLHKFVGPDYFEKIVLPIIESSTRESVAKYTSADAFTNDIKKINQTISLDTTNLILKRITPTGLSDVRLISINDVQLIKFSFPQDVETALESKAIELAKAEAYTYRIMAETKEAERKQIEAVGIRNFQDTVQGGLTDNYIRWRGVEATSALAASNNSKVIVFGQGQTGLPLILGEMDRPDYLKSTPQKSSTVFNNPPTAGSVAPATGSVVSSGIR